MIEKTSLECSWLVFIKKKNFYALGVAARILAIVLRTFG